MAGQGGQHGQGGQMCEAAGGQAARPEVQDLYSKSRQYTTTQYGRWTFTSLWKDCTVRDCQPSDNIQDQNEDPSSNASIILLVWFHWMPTHLESSKSQQVVHLVVPQATGGLRQHMQLLKQGAGQRKAAQQALSCCCSEHATCGAKRTAETRCSCAL
jgi:hypothetical protein